MTIEIIIALSLVGLVCYLLYRSSVDQNETHNTTEAPSDTTIYAVKVDAVPAAAEVHPVIETVQEPTPQPKRARNKGKLVADDPTTADVNEAWEGGKAPAKKQKPKKPKMKVVKK
jgi:hypothetical protein